jgi:hypothetical protein
MPRILGRQLTFAAVAAVAVGTFVGTGETHAAHARSSMLLIDDTNAIGAIGDGKLSLDEAIRLANGSLNVRQLDPDERAQIHGSPGRHSADRMVVVLPHGSTITAEHEVSPLQKNTGDVLDGNDVTLAGDGSGTALRISSSDFTLTNVAVQGFLAGLDIDPAGKSLHNITITRAKVAPAPLGGMMVGSTRSHGRLSGLTITDSVFDGGILNIGDALRYFFEQTGTPTVELLTVGITAGRTMTDAVSNTSLKNVLFARNKVINGFEGFYVMGGLVNGGSVDHSVVRHVLVLDNEFTGVPDASLNAIGAEGLGDAAHNGVEDLTIAGNVVMAADWGIALWGGEEFGNGNSHDNYVRNADIHDNVVTGQPGIAGSPSDCIDLEGAWATLFPGTQSNSSISDVRIHDNWVGGQCAVGIKATAAVSFLAANTITSGNSVFDVSIERNHVEGATTAMEIIGGYSQLAPVGARSEGNSVYHFRVEANTFVGTGSGTAVHLAGGMSPRATVTKNSVDDVTFTDNDINGYAVPCLSEADNGQGASDNSNTVVCP